MHQGYRKVARVMADTRGACSGPLIDSEQCLRLGWNGSNLGTKETIQLAGTVRL
jgi:hypothetical protein